MDDKVWEEILKDYKSVSLENYNIKYDAVLKQLAKDKEELDKELSISWFVDTELLQKYLVAKMQNEKLKKGGE